MPVHRRVPARGAKANGNVFARRTTSEIYRLGSYLSYGSATSLAGNTSPQGLLVIGDTGSGKTWVMWRLLRRLLKERRSVVVLDAVTYRSGLSKAAREGETEEYVQRLARVEVLYWDDFGQTHLSAAASEMLLHVLEKRTSHQRPVLVTSQYRGAALELQFERPEMGAAVRRRINEFCRVVTAGEILAI
jgi:DNA replication protein DnaC